MGDKTGVNSSAIFTLQAPEKSKTEVISLRHKIDKCPIKDVA